jgi:hypothetical protein
MPRLRFPVRPEFHTSVRPEPVEGRIRFSHCETRRQQANRGNINKYPSCHSRVPDGIPASSLAIPAQAGIHTKTYKRPPRAHFIYHPVLDTGSRKVRKKRRRGATSLEILIRKYCRI